MKKVLFYSNGIGFGGVERVLLEILQGIKSPEYNFFLGLEDGDQDDLLEEIPKGINYSFMVDKKLRVMLKEVKESSKKSLVKKLKSKVLKIKRKHILNKRFNSYCNFDIAIDFKSGDFLKRISKVKGKKICWFHSSLSEANAYKKNKNKLLKNLMLTDKIVVLSNEMRREFLLLYPELKDKIKVIYNPINLKKVREKSLEKTDLTIDEKALLKDNYVIAVGRFEKKHKDFETLIKSYSLIKDKIDYKLYIVGDGDDRRELEELIGRLSLKESVILLGFKKNPYVWIKNASLFIHSSRSEGFGMVLVEAMACNTPIIATDCPVSPREILLGGECGELVPVGDVKKMSKSILELLVNERKRKKYIEKSNQRVHTFSIEKISKEIELLFNEVSEI